MNTIQEPLRHPARLRLRAALLFTIILGMTLTACRTTPAGFLQKHPNVEPFNFQVSLGLNQYQIAGYFARSTEAGRLPTLLVLSGDGDSAERCVEANTEVLA